ncbi:MAG: DNA polymerase I, partial [Phycisphaerales bacterium]|nr:DNA polymerase I [Phycisphaerales bacterium]
GRADYIAVALDVGGDKETFRSGLYPAYKANRPDAPVDLRPQVDRALAMLQAMGVPVIGSPGFEADDVIAGIAKRLREAHPGLRLRIISKDKDLKQLLCDKPACSVELFDIHTDAVIDVAALKADLGLTPAQVIDMLALMGDTVDNVPGVPGVGPKTASDLIAQYGTLENLLEKAEEVKGKRGEAIRAARDAKALILSKQLVSLRDDAPMEFDLHLAAREKLNLAAMIPILKELGFNRYQEDVKALIGGAVSVESGESAQMPTLPTTPTGREPARAKKAPPGGGGPSLFDGFAATTDGTGASATAGPDRASAGAYRCVRTKAELKELLAELTGAPWIALDTETTGLSPILADLCGLSFATSERTGWYVPVRSPEPENHLDAATVLAALRPVLEDAGKPKCGHNLKFDLMVLRKAGITLRGVDFDSMVASYLIDASRSSHSLDALALALLGHSNISIKELIGSGSAQRTFDTVPLAQATEYAAEDADIALRLKNAMDTQLDELGLRDLFRSLEMPLTVVLGELEWNGVLVDPAELDRQRERLGKQIVVLKDRIDVAAMETIGRTFNPDSPRQLAGVLFNKPDATDAGLGLKPLKKTPKGEPSTDVEVLEKLADDATITTPIPALIVEYRTLTKLVSTYLVALKEAINPLTHRIHASFNQTVAVTGRLASSDPNLQNIPIRTDVGKEIRRAFIAPPGRTLVSADYSQIELRLLAHLSRDPALIDAFHQGIDIHTAVAAQVNNVKPEEVTKAQRSGAKMVNFGIVYGVTPFGLARRLGVPTSEAEAIITGYKKRFAGITTFLQECIEFAQTNGYVETMLKRRRNLPDIHSNIPARRAFAERNAINSVVQGSAADLIKLAMVDLHARFTGPTPPVANVKMLLQIHDELVFETDTQTAEAARDVIVDRMEKAMTLSVPLKADSSIAANWFDGK